MPIWAILDHAALLQNLVAALPQIHYCITAKPHARATALPYIT